MATISPKTEPTSESTNSTVDTPVRVVDEVQSGGVVWFCVLGILSFLAYHYFLGQADSKLTREIRSRIQTLLPDYHVSLDSATLQSGESITLNGLCLLKRSTTIP